MRNKLCGKLNIKAQGQEKMELSALSGCLSTCCYHIVVINNSVLCFTLGQQ